MADWTPQSRSEEILFKTINGEPYDGLPQSRIEELLLELKDVIESGGGGGGGTDNYNLLKNLPQINGQTVKGNMSGTTLGLVNMVMGKDLSTNDYTNADKAIVDSVTADLADKVDKITGKGLSTNDYTNADKSIVDGVTSALAGKVDKVTGKGLSTNDYDDTAKGIVDGVTSALAEKVDTSLVGSANGVAELDSNGRVPSSQLPSYVDDTVEGYLNSVDGKFYADSSYTTEITGETGKIYVTLDTNKTYRWSGSGFVEISESLALGETSSTAYAGNKGKANADAIAAIKDGTNIDSFGDVETALAGKADVSSLADYASLDNSGGFPDANTVTKELVYINGFQSGLTNYPSEVSNTVGILLTRWFYYSGDLTVARMQLVFTLGGASFCRFTDGTSWTPWSSTSVGLLANLTTTDKSSCVAAINELVSGASLHDIGNDYTFADLTAEKKVTWFSNWTDNVNFPVLYGSGVLMPGTDLSQKCIIYVVIGANGNGEVYTNAYRNGAWGKWNGPGLTYGVYSVNNATDVKDFIKKAIQQAHTDLANKKAYTLYNIFAEYIGNDNYYGTVERQDTAGYAFSLSKASGDNIYQGYYDISSDHMNVFRYDGTAI